MASYTGVENPGPSSGIISNDYAGSYQDWVSRAARDLATRYMNGDPTWENFFNGAGADTSVIGQPNRADAGTGQHGAATGTISEQTYTFFENYLKQYGQQDPWIQSQYGPPPIRQATYEEDPNSPGAIAAAGIADNDKQRTWESGENAADRAAQLEATRISADASKYGADKQFEGVKLSVENSWREAQLEDATRRYIAEGDWGIQKYVAELQDKGETTRLQMTLQQREKERIDAAAAEKDRHHEAMMGLVMQVAQYDAELASEPRNWIAYAVWLQNRDVVVNGLTLSMAADVVPEQAISPQELSASGAGVAALQTAQTQGGGWGAYANGQSGGGTGQPGVPATGPSTVPMQAQQQGQTGQYVVNGVDLGGSDYTAIAKQLLGQTGASAAVDPAALGAASATLQTGQRAPAFQAYGGPTTNALGMQIQPSGQKEDYRQFSKLLPTQQQMRLGEIDSIRGKAGTNDYIRELQASRPKGGTRGSTAWG